MQLPAAKRIAHREVHPKLTFDYYIAAFPLMRCHGSALGMIVPCKPEKETKSVPIKNLVAFLSQFARALCEAGDQHLTGLNL